MILKLIEKFGCSIADALFWILIIFSVAGALVWLFNGTVNFLLKEPKIKKTETKEPEE